MFKKSAFLSVVGMYLFLIGCATAPHHMQYDISAVKTKVTAIRASADPKITKTEIPGKRYLQFSYSIDDNQSLSGIAIYDQKGELTSLSIALVQKDQQGQTTTYGAIDNPLDGRLNTITRQKPAAQLETWSGAIHAHNGWDDEFAKIPEKVINAFLESKID